MSGKSKRGFASMSPDKQREIASKGGKAAHAKGTAHEFTPEEARAAGRKGGQAAHRRGTAHQFTPEEAREAGRKGGQSSHAGGQAGTGVTERPYPSEGGDDFAPQPEGNGQRGFPGENAQNLTRQPADETRPFQGTGPETVAGPPAAPRTDKEANVAP